MSLSQELELRPSMQSLAALFPGAGGDSAQATEAERLLLRAGENYDAGQLAMAAFMARKALATFEELRDFRGQLSTLRLMVRANLHSDSDKAVAAAERGVTICQWQEDRKGEASMYIAAACAHVSRIETAMGRRHIYSSQSALGAIKAARAAFMLYSELGDPYGAHEALGVISGLSQEMGMGDAHGIAAKIETDGADVFNTMEGANRQERMEITNDNYLRQMEWQAYPQRDSGCGLWWTFTWDPFLPSGASDKARKAHTLVSGMAPKSLAAPMYQSIASVREQPVTVDKKTAMAVHFISTAHATQAYGACLMEMVQTIAGLNMAKVQRLSLVQLGEGNPDPFNPSFEVGNVNFHPVALALLRCARLDCPNMTISLISGDAASWMAERKKMVEAIFDSTSISEVEQMYSRGDCYVQTMVPFARSPQPGPERIERNVGPQPHARLQKQPSAPNKAPYGVPPLMVPRAHGKLQPPTLRHDAKLWGIGVDGQNTAWAKSSGDAVTGDNQWGGGG